jgi:hypothetical protein
MFCAGITPGALMMQSGTNCRALTVSGVNMNMKSDILSRPILPIAFYCFGQSSGRIYTRHTEQR